MLVRVAARRPLAALILVVFLASCATGQTGIGLDLVPPEQVRQMGLDSWQAIRAETPPSDNPQYQRRVQGVADRVLRGAGKDPRAWEVEVFKGADANAFALPGNKIGVFEGMLGMADTDDMLAAVIGHEIAHNDANHASQRLSSQIAARAGLDIAASALGTSNLGSQELIATVLGAGVQYGLILPYSRNQELEADRLGLNSMARAGYDPRGAIALWRKMGAQGGQPPAFLSTHPAPQQRIEQLQAMLPEAMALYGGGR